MNEFIDRIEKLYRLFGEKKVDLMILTANTDLYYYSGSVAPLYFLAPADGDPILIARKAVDRIASEAPHLRLEVFGSSKELKAILTKYGFDSSKRIGFTLDSISYASVQRWLELLPDATPVDISWEVRALRMVKSASELKILSKAGEIMAGLAEVVKACFKPGISEVELSALIEGFMRIQGHTGLVRCRREGIEMGFGVCSSGRNSLSGTKFDGVCAGSGISPAVPYGSSFRLIGRGEPVTLDYAFNLDGYHVDQTRMLCWGEPTEQIAAAYEAMVRVERQIFAAMKPGAGWSDIYDLAVNLAREEGYEKEFMGLGTEKVRFVGHGIGLELDEPPFIAPKQQYSLEEGMVVAIEPKVALADIGVVGIEDTVVIRADGVEPLTRCPAELIVIHS